MKKLLTILLLTGLIFMGACSKAEGEQEVKDDASSNKDVVSKEDNVVSGPSDHNREDVAKTNATDSEDSSINESTDTTETDSGSASEDTEVGQNEEATTNGSLGTDLNVEMYLNEHYAIENTHYSLDTWENEETGRTEYIVRIMPNTEQFGEEIEEVFENGNPYMDDERTENMFKVAEELLVDLPQLDDKVHIESVLWSTAEDEFPILLIQDRAQSTIN
ncbi:hypothetical protein OBCHQ24_05730 [Oceanobacillus iheyensis]|nr:hypothetical protein OBCHQ24_05730 [Oceanobacillus iheyensis]